MKNTNSTFWYNKSQRSGILFLGIIIIALQLIYLFSDFSNKFIDDLNTLEITQLQASIDSLKQIELENRKPKIYPFNPSFITDYKGAKLGMSIKEIDKLLNYRKKEKYINSAKQFQQVTGISDSLLKTMQPFFKFPDWISNKTKSSTKKTAIYKGKKTNLNLATLESLKQINGIGNKLSKRILKFKTSIGGFQNKEQLQKVYGLKPEVVELILDRFYIKENTSAKVKTTTTDINKATANDFKTITGIGDKLSQRIIKYRKSIQGFSFKDQLNDVYGLKPEVITKIAQQFKILEKPNIKKLNINEATFKEVLHLPYIDYELTKKIFNYRDEFAEIQTLEELKKIESFPLDKYDRIVLYLKTE